MDPDPEHSLKRIKRCHLCWTLVPPLHIYCNICDKSLCENCAEKHRCVHALGIKKVNLRKDLEELKKSIYPKYQDIATYTLNKKAELYGKSQKLITAIDKHGENLHREIDIAISKLKSGLDEIDSKHFTVLEKWENEITHTISEITDIIADLNNLLKSNDASLVSAYKSRNAEFRKLPPKPIFSLPSFTPPMINKENIHQQIGCLSTSSTIIEEHGNARDSLKAESTPLDRPLIDVPRIITGLKTEYEHILCRVLCLTDEQIWTCGYSGSIMRLYNLQGVLVKSIKTKSGNWQADITVTQSGDLVYTDEDDKTVNTVKNTQIQTVIRLQVWRPVCVCSTSSGDLLVATVSDDNKHTKIVRYCDFTAKQSIQYDYKGQALFSPGPYIKCIIENRNLDICVVDSRAQSVVVVNQVGELRFTYNGFPSPSKPFKPVGITTDSQSRILIADFNNRIHILDQEGKLLRYIDNCGLHRPVSVCVDSQDNLFVAELSPCAVKKIQYCALNK